VVVVWSSSDIVEGVEGVEGVGEFTRDVIIHDTDSTYFERVRKENFYEKINK
jgi:hypothetical protein